MEIIQELIQGLHVILLIAVGGLLIASAVAWKAEKAKNETCRN